MTNLKRFPENDFHVFENSYLEATKSADFKSIPDIVPKDGPTTSMGYTAPGTLPPRKGKKLALTFLAAAVAFAAYNTWDTYLRYDSFGVVESGIVGIYTSNAGTIKTLVVKEGDQIAVGDLIARVENTENSRQAAKIQDEIVVAKAELATKRSEINQALLNIIHLLETQIASEQTLINELLQRLKHQKVEQIRLLKLRAESAAGAQEVDSVRAAVDSTTSLISGKTATIANLKARLAIVKNSANDGTAIKFIETKIAYLEGEAVRTAEKIAEGNILSTVDGVVSSVKRQPGELIATDPIVTVAVNETANLVLYYDPSDRLPQIGSVIDVTSLSIGKTLHAKVTSVSKDVTLPPDQIKKNYRANQMLIKVYLQPEGVSIKDFVIGSVIKRPNPSDVIKQSIQMVQDTITPTTAVAHPR